jgi:hypothetical protein
MTDGQRPSVHDRVFLMTWSLLKRFTIFVSAPMPRSIALNLSVMPVSASSVLVLDTQVGSETTHVVAGEGELSRMPTRAAPSA